MRTLTSDNDKLKQHIHQTDRTIAQLKKDNEELHQKVTKIILIIIKQNKINTFWFFQNYFKKIDKKLSILLSLIDPSFASDKFFSSSQVNSHELITAWLV